MGKFAKFERQNDRHLDSYGLVSTSFNRFEDSGIEFGIDVTPWLYMIASWTTGNPVFFRDPNALAGDNGTDDRRHPPPNPDPHLKSGMLLLYDAEIESFHLEEDPEYGLGLGLRFHPQPQTNINVLFFGYQRQLDDDRQLHGTFYGADLDLLDGVPGFTGLIDYGLRIDFAQGIQLTLEYADNHFIRQNKTEDNDEFLATLAWRINFF